MSVRIIIGDAREQLKLLPSESVHCIVTSPPYWGLRDYGCEGQIGLEESPQAFVDEMVSLFREARRVLRSDGTLWLNLGDSYAGSGRGGKSAPETSTLQGSGTSQEKSKGLQPRSVRGSRVDAGMHEYAVRSGAIGRAWVPPPMGLKQKDLVGIPWLVAFALRADGWYLRQDIIWTKPNPMPESVTDRCTKAHEYLFLLSKTGRYFYDVDAIREPFADASIERLRQDIASLRGSVPGKTNGTMKAVGNASWKGSTFDGPRDLAVRPDTGRRSDINANRSSYRPGSASNMNEGKHIQKSDEGLPLNDCGRNKRSVWEVSTQPFSLAHFATFPPALIEPCILAGCPKGGVVLDPFGGAGTTGLVADRLQRNAILIELNPEYAAMARKRIDGDAPLFATAE